MPGVTLHVLAHILMYDKAIPGKMQKKDWATRVETWASWTWDKVTSQIPDVWLCI